MTSASSTGTTVCPTTGTNPATSTGIVYSSDRSTSRTPSRRPSHSIRRPDSSTSLGGPQRSSSTFSAMCS